MPAKMCQYGSCIEEGGAQGIVVSLKTPTRDDESRAIYCCASRAASALQRLALDRTEEPCEMPRQWRST